MKLPPLAIPWLPRRFSLKYKLFILLAAISIIPIALVYYSSNYFMFRSGTEYSSNVASQYVEFVSRDITSYLNDLNRTLDPLITNSDFQKFLYVAADDYVSQANYSIGFRQTIRSALQSRKELLGVLYLDRRQKVYFESYSYSLNVRFPFYNDPFYLKMFEMRTPSLTTKHAMDYTMGASPQSVAFVKPVIDLHTGEVVSWIVMEIDETFIAGMLRNSRQEWDSQLILYSGPDGAVIADRAPDPRLLGDLAKQLTAAETFGEESGKGNVFQSGSIPYEASFKPLAFGEWTLVWYAPLNSLTKGMRNSSFLTLLVALSSLLIALIVAFPVMRLVLQPLYKLMRGMKGVGRGTYVPVQLPAGNDEFGSLIQSYNRMLADLETMEQEVYRSKLKEKERELLQLQAQINPHFLFNTLETIESYALSNNGETVGDMVQSVSKMMRYNARNDGGWAPVREEIGYIRHFLNIHRYRHGVEVGIDLDIDPRVLDIPVMKLGIQPFVENSFKYGWSPSMSPSEFRLTLQAKLEGESLFIEVRDTGVGMPPDVLDRLTRMIEAGGETDDPFFVQHTGIYNVCRRYMLAYGQQAHISIGSTPGGTVVSISIPLDQRGEPGAGR